jgi:hypothetical protein
VVSILLATEVTTSQGKTTRNWSEISVAHSDSR